MNVTLVVLEIHRNIVFSVVNCSLQEGNIALNRNYSYVLPFYRITDGINAIGSFPGSFLAVQCSTMQNTVTELCSA
jgi:hypothetical protein